MHSPKAVDLRQQGLSLQEIADRLGCGRLDAFRALIHAKAIVDAATGRANVTSRVPQ